MKAGKPACVPKKYLSKTNMQCHFCAVIFIWFVMWLVVEVM
jgi:hypothetical protein